MKHGAGCGYARTFLTQMEQVLGTCLDRGIKVVSNAGGLDPAGLRRRAAREGRRARARPRADRGRRGRRPDAPDRRAARGRRGVRATSTPASRSPTVGMPAAHRQRLPRRRGDHRGPGRRRRRRDLAAASPTPRSSSGPPPGGTAGDDDDATSTALAGAVVAGPRHRVRRAGHRRQLLVLHRRARLEHLGFPIAEVAADGSSVITKHDGTGGLVSVGTVTAQLLYEIGGPAYANPDVTARFDTIAARPGRPRPVRDQRHPRRAAAGDAQGRAELPRRLPQHHDAGADRARHRGEGRPRAADHRGLTLAEARQRVAAALDLGVARSACASCTSSCCGATGATRRRRPRPRRSCGSPSRTADPKKVGKAFTAPAVESALASYPGMFPTAPPGRGDAVRRLLAHDRPGRRSSCRP